MKMFIYKVRLTLHVYKQLILLFGYITKEVLKFPDPRMKERMVFVLKSLIVKLSTQGVQIIQTVEDSKKIYERVDSDIKGYYNDSDLCLVKNKVVKLTHKEIRGAYLAHVFTEIDRILAQKDTAKIMEVGCGNGINIFEIIQKYGNRVEVYGIDISENRIKICKDYFGPGIASAKLSVASITEKTPFLDNQFDLVYSVHCLEQIAYDTKPALREMYRISGNRILMLEPVFENGTFLQKSYLMLYDYTRIVLKSINELGYSIEKNEVLELQGNLVNQSSILIVNKRR